MRGGGHLVHRYARLVGLVLSSITRSGRRRQALAAIFADVGTAFAIAAGMASLIGLAYVMLDRAHPRIWLDVAMTGGLNPSELGIDIRLGVGRFDYTNLAVFEIEVQNKSRRDLELISAADHSTQDRRTRIEFPDGCVLVADPWIRGGAKPGGHVIPARSLSDNAGRQNLSFHMHTLGAQQAVTIVALCTWSEAAEIRASPSDFRWFPGYVPGFRVIGKGLLGRGAIRLEA